MLVKVNIRKKTKKNKIKGILYNKNFNKKIEIMQKNIYYKNFKKNKKIEILILNIKKKVLIKEIQKHPIKKLILHIELFEINE